MEIISTSIVLGVLSSALIQIIKKYLGLKTVYNYAIVAVISLIIAYLYSILYKSDYWPVVVQTIAYSGAVYTFLISKFTK